MQNSSVGNGVRSGCGSGGGRAAEDHGGAVAPVAALPCLNTINCNGPEELKLHRLAPSHRKTAYALWLNVLFLIERHGLDRIGFLTLTFARHVVSHQEAQKALHSLMSGVLKRRYREYIVVVERMSSQRIHYHLLVVMAQDIRTGFDFQAVKRGDYRSASAYLRAEWAFWRNTAPRYGFGRTELLPIRKTAEGVAKYVGKYIAKHIGQRLAQDKGARLVRYSKGTNRVGTRFSWASTGAFMWRLKLGAFCRMLGLTEGNYQAKLRQSFGRNWVHSLRPVIDSIKPPEFHPEAQANASLAAAWAVALNERQRRLNRKDSCVEGVQRPVPSAEAGALKGSPAPPWATWIERSVKEEAA